MKKLIPILFLLSFTANADSDIELFVACFGAEPTLDCEKADYNDDGVINLLDFSIFRQCAAVDLTDDQVVDFNLD